MDWPAYFDYGIMLMVSCRFGVDKYQDGRDFGSEDGCRVPT